MDENKILERMAEFEKVIGYHFSDVSNYKRAMSASRVKIIGEGKNHREYSNDAIATIGDAFLKTVLARKLFEEGCETKGEITQQKECLEKNLTMYDLMDHEGWTKYIFNEDCFYDEDFKQNKKPPFNKHVQYVEALVGAMLLDSDYETTEEWIILVLRPLLEKYKHEPKPHN